MDFTKLQKITVISNSEGYGPRPEDNEEVKQRLTISRCGRVWFFAYAYSGARLRGKQVWIGQDAARRLLGLIGDCFASYDEGCFATDIGMWEARLKDNSGEAVKFTGSLCCHFWAEGKNLAGVIRETLDMDDLLLFDGESEQRSEIADEVSV